jgi:hypothetical protein
MPARPQNLPHWDLVRSLGIKTQLERTSFFYSDGAVHPPCLNTRNAQCGKHHVFEEERLVHPLVHRPPELPPPCARVSRGNRVKPCCGLTGRDPRGVRIDKSSREARGVDPSAFCSIVLWLWFDGGLLARSPPPPRFTFPLFCWCPLNIARLPDISIVYMCIMYIYIYIYAASRHSNFLAQQNVSASFANPAMPGALFLCISRKRDGREGREEGRTEEAGAGANEGNMIRMHARHMRVYTSCWRWWSYARNE